MDNLLDLLDAVRGVVGHGNVRWDVSDTGEIILYTGLTGRDEAGKVMADHRGLILRQTNQTVDLQTMGD